MKPKEHIQAKMKMEAAINFLKKAQQTLTAAADDLEQTETFDLDLEEVRLSLSSMIDSLLESVRQL